MSIFFIIIYVNLTFTRTTHKVSAFYKEYKFFIRFQSETRYIGVNCQVINTTDGIRRTMFITGIASSGY